MLFQLAAVLTLDRAFSNDKGGCKTSAFTQARSAEFLMLQRKTPSIERARSYGVSSDDLLSQTF
ncbi:hypothetical protein QUA56_18040 [Microcoleus sp. N3A4]